MSGCFCYLVNHTEQAVRDGEHSLALLAAHYLQQFPVPVVLFHEAALTDEMKWRLTAALGPTVPTFAPVDFSGYPRGAATVPGGSWDLGYLNMCRFFTSEVFRHPALSGFDYYCRLDTDSNILAPVTYDLFAHAERVGALYGFLNDELRTHADGLATAVKNFTVKHPEWHTHELAHEGRLYYTNFEICYLPWFRRDPWQTFARFIDETGGIYTHRWGDHVIRYAGVKLLMPPSAIWHCEHVAYSHQGIGANHAS